MIYWLTDRKGEKKGKKKVAERSKFDHIFSINLYTTVSRLSKLFLSETFWKKIVFQIVKVISEKNIFQIMAQGQNDKN